MYRSIIVVTLLTLSLSGCVAGTVQPEQTMQPVPKWPDMVPVASYDIQVALDAQTKALSGHEVITYVNTSQTPIKDAVLHLYLNAFRDDHSSIFMQESGPVHRGFSLNPKYPGSIQVTDIRLADEIPLFHKPIEDEILACAGFPR